MSLALTSQALRSPCAPRTSAPVMGFGPSPKELSNDPPIKEVLKITQAEQRERFARANMKGMAFARTLPGAGPWGFFDPLGLTPEDQDEVLLYREAEIVHGRVAMMAAVGFLVQESFHPIFGYADGPVVRQLDEVLSTENGQLGGSILLMAIFFSEIARARAGWMEPPKDPTVYPPPKYRQLRPGYTPGDLNFDPLSYSTKLDEVATTAMRNKELNNGRLAMIGVAGMTGQELVTNTPIFAF